MTNGSSTASSRLMVSVQRTYEASLILGATKGIERSRAVRAIADALDEATDDILEANTLDLEVSREMAVPDLILEWLKLTPERLNHTVETLRRLSELPDPLRRVMNASYQLDRAQTYCQLMPLGVIALIYETLPELAAIAAGLCMKTGNSLLLRGGTEASQSNQAIAQAICGALEKVGFPSGAVELIPADSGATIRDLVKQDDYINLVIPYGRPSLVQQVVRQSTAPVLRSAMGNCYLYWSPTGSLELTRSIIIDSHQSEPDPVNAIEKVLIHSNQKPSLLTMLWNNLQESGFEIRVDAELHQEFPGLAVVQEDEWHQSYLSKTVAFKRVNSIETAIRWINKYSSGHADCLVTESYLESSQFSAGINSASIYINSSPRFYRYNKQQSDGIFLGMSNQKGHRRGLISLETLTTLKHIVQGTGQV